MSKKLVVVVVVVVVLHCCSLLLFFIVVVVVVVVVDIFQKRELGHQKTQNDSHFLDFCELFVFPSFLPSFPPSFTKKAPNRSTFDTPSSIINMAKVRKTRTLFP